MPIRPENRELYPDDWSAIALEVKVRASWRCECEGECGHEHSGRCPERHGEISQLSARCHTIMLTCAHLDHDPRVRDPERLRALCQGCHLRLDVEHHRASRRVAELCALERSGQLKMELVA